MGVPPLSNANVPWIFADTYFISFFPFPIKARVSSYKPMNLVAEDPEDACDAAYDASDACYGEDCFKCEDDAGEDDAAGDACYEEGGACAGKEEECSALDDAIDEACPDDDDDDEEGGDGPGKYYASA